MRIATVVRLSLGVLAVTASVSAHAWEPADKAGIRKVIREQVQAINRSDSVVFAGTVTPGLRSQFPNEDALYGILVGKIAALDGAKEFGFGPLKTTPVGLVQTLRFTDTSGAPWVGMFIMEQQNGRWFVKGVNAKKLDAQKA